MTKYKSKAQMNWEIGKEREERLKKCLLKESFSIDNNPLSIDGFNIDELFSMIRQTEYRRGKEDALKEIKK